MKNDTLVAVDIAKEVFEVGVSDRPGHVAHRRRLARYEFLEFFAQLPPATVVMEACGSAHYWARRIEELSHVVVLLPPQYVRPYVVRNKTDRKDVDGLLEAFRNERIKRVPIQSVTQQVLGTLHRLRSGWLGDRTRAINSLRGLLRELGFFIPEGVPGDRFAIDAGRGDRGSTRGARQTDPRCDSPALGAGHRAALGHRPLCLRG
jgi:transposase